MTVVFDHPTVIEQQIESTKNYAEKVAKYKKCKISHGPNLKRLNERLLEKTEFSKAIGIEYEVLGDRVLRYLRETVRKFKLTKQQLTFTEVFIQAGLPFIYQDDYFANEIRIKQENFIDQLFQTALVCCPRRFGKTFSVGVFAACLLLCVPNTDIIIFSPSQRQSYYIMGLIRKNLAWLAEKYGYKFEFVAGKNNKETLAICVDGNERIVKGLPAKQETTRGSGGNWVICEEAAAMPVKFYIDVVLPVTGPTTTATICISTIQGANAEGQQNWYTSLMNLVKPDGRPRFNVFKLYLACKKCMEEDKAATCKHLLHDLPFWQDPTKQMELRAIMTELGHGDSAAQELIGVNKKELRPVFPLQIVQSLFNDSRTPLVRPHDLTEDVKMIFCTIDPSLGGEKSRTSVFSAFWFNGLIGCGAESIDNTLDTDYRPIIINHIRRIRTVRRLENAYIVVCIENNTVGPARNIMLDLLQLKIDNLIIMTKPGMDLTHVDMVKAKTCSFGVRTQGQQGEGNMKEDMVMKLKDSLEMKQIRFYSEFLVTEVKDNEDMKTIYFQRLVNQLKNFAMKIQLPTSEFTSSNAKKTYSGKHMGPDDDVFALMMNNYWIQIFLKKHDLLRRFI
jgi:Terminase large subunit, T4likevirus-type, N-terminal